MIGHGWITPRPDGMKAKCGGPGLCRECQQEQADRERDLVAAAKLRDAERLPTPARQPSYSVEEHIVNGETLWIAIRARNADLSWLKPDECVAIARRWLELYEPKP